MADSLIGQALGSYRITRLLAHTGMSKVYLARDAKLRRDVVIKVMLPSHGRDQSFAARFQQEALATARLTHSNIVSIYDFGQREDLSYIVMEYLPRGSLYDHLVAATRAGKRLDPAYSAAIVRQIALALDYAHQAGITHRDVKPSNILFASDGRPVLTDLGIAKAREGPRLTRTMATIGTPEYMSPEQGRGEPVDGRSDIYSLGVVLYELLCGVLPFQADTPWALIHKHMYDAPRPIRAISPAVSPAMRSVVEKALAKRPEDRFRTARELAGALQHALEAPARRLYPPPPHVAPPEFRAMPAPSAARSAPRGIPLWLGAGAIVLALMMVFLFNGVLRPPASDTPASPAQDPAGFSVPAKTAPAPTSTLGAPGVDGTGAGLAPGRPAAPIASTVTPAPAPRATTSAAATRPAVQPTASATAEAGAQAVTGSLPAPVLLAPADYESRSGQVTFTWRWDGPALTANQGFEVRIWKEGQYSFGAAEPTNAVSLVINLPAARGVMEGGAGTYFWTVAVVQRSPYERVAPAAPSRRLQVTGTGGGSAPPPAGPRPTPTRRPPSAGAQRTTPQPDPLSLAGWFGIMTAGMCAGFVFVRATEDLPEQG